jgi:hypothetical protein
MSLKTQSIGALFLALVLILLVNPKIVNNIYNSVLGRLFLLIIIAFVTMNNRLLGLLVVLAIIIAINQYGSLTEGMDNLTVGEENVPVTGNQVVLTKSATDAVKKTISNLKSEIAEGTMGIDKEDIKNAIMSKDSKTIPTDPNMNRSEEVNAHTPNMIDNSSTLTEAFYSPYSRV